MQSRKVVLVVLGRVERDLRDELRDCEMRAVELVDRHLIGFQIDTLDTPFQAANHDLQAEFFLLGEPRGIHGLKFCQPLLQIALLLLNVCER